MSKRQTLPEAALGYPPGLVRELTIPVQPSGIEAGEAKNAIINALDDFGSESPATEFAKADLASAISRIIAWNGWTQEEAARQMATEQTTVSKITRVQLGELSVDQLLGLLNQMDFAIEIIVRQVEGNDRTGIEVRFLEPPNP